MATYDSIVSRSDAAALIPEEVSREVLSKATQASAALSLFRRIPVSRAQHRIPILSALPTAYWVDGDTGLKQTTEVNWANKYLNIEELAVIVPIPQNVLDDTAFNVWDEATPLLSESIGRAFDSAVFFGTNAPASFPDDILSAATSANNINTEDDDAAHGGFVGDLDDTVALLEADGYDPTGFVASRNTKAKFRAARSTLGEQLDRYRLNGSLTEWDGMPVIYPMRGLFGATTRLFALESDQFILGLRKDITMDMSSEAVIQDNTGQIIYNMFQQDMVAMRITFRAGWQVANVINYDQPTEAERYPAAVQVYGS
jgi:HK97 family phage major capsid protein